jgi:hypothetical protein
VAKETEAVGTVICCTVHSTEDLLYLRSSIVPGSNVPVTENTCVFSTAFWARARAASLPFLVSPFCTNTGPSPGAVSPPWPSTRQSTFCKTGKNIAQWAHFTRTRTLEAVRTKVSLSMVE